MAEFGWRKSATFGAIVSGAMHPFLRRWPDATVHKFEILKTAPR